jgi:hypothetical protein
MAQFKITFYPLYHRSCFEAKLWEINCGYEEAECMDAANVEEYR